MIALHTDGHLISLFLVNELSGVDRSIDAQCSVGKRFSDRLITKRQVACCHSTAESSSQLGETGQVT